MKMFSRVWILALTGVMLVSCSNKKEFRIEGTLHNGAGKKVEVRTLFMNKWAPADSAEVDKNDHFVLSSEVEQPTFALLQTLQNHFITLIVKPGDRITVNADYENIENQHSIEGSEDTQFFEDFLSHLRENAKKLNELKRIYRDSAKSPRFNDILANLNSRSAEILKDQQTYAKKFVEEHLNSLASMLVLYQQISPGRYILDPVQDFKYYVMVDSALNAEYPKADPVIAFHAQMTGLRERRREQDDINRMLGIGKIPPDIALPTPDGDTLQLSSLRGKVVLLDFWASWCGPCRRENPNLVKEYNRFHRKGFDIFQVSLDRTKEAWLNGIKQDHLEQWHHVSDLGYWQSSVVKLYHIQGIPTNYLLDKNGKIIAKNLRGQALAQKLEEILGN